MKSKVFKNIAFGIVGGAAIGAYITAVIISGYSIFNETGSAIDWFITAIGLHTFARFFEDK